MVLTTTYNLACQAHVEDMAVPSGALGETVRGQAGRPAEGRTPGGWRQTALAHFQTEALPHIPNF